MNPQQYATYGAPPPQQQQQFYGRTGSAAFGAAQFGTVGRTGSMTGGSGGGMAVPLHAWSPPSPQEHQYYDMLFAVADEEKRNAIGGRIAVAFFSRSGVDKLHLREIWTIADSQQRSELSRNEFHVAMRLISMAQRGEQVSAQRFYELASTPFPLPTFEGIAPPPMMAPPMMQPPSHQVPPPVAPAGQPSGGYAVTDEEKQRYNGIFQQYDTDHDGFLHGGEAVQLFGMSGLDRGVLREIWALADRGQDSRLDVKEFYIAMHLIVCVSKRGLPLPKELPADLAESVFPKRSSFSSASPDPLASLASAAAPGSRTGSTTMPHIATASTPTAPMTTPVSVQQDTTPLADPMDAFAGLSPVVETAQPSHTGSFGGPSSASSQPSTSMPPPAARLSATGSSLDAAMSSLNLTTPPVPTPPASSTGSFSGSAIGTGMGMGMGMGMTSSHMSMGSMPEPARERAGSASSMSSFASVSTDASAAYGPGGMAHASSAAPPAPTPSFSQMGSYATPPPHAYSGAPPAAAKPFLADEAEAAAVAQLDRSNDELVQALQSVEKKQHAVELLSEKLRELDQLRHELVTLSMKRDTLQAASSASSVAPTPPRDSGADVQAVRAVEQTLRQLVDSEQAAIQKLQADIGLYERELLQLDASPPASGGVALNAFGAPTALPTALPAADSTPKNDFEAFGGFGSSSPAPDSAALAAGAATPARSEPDDAFAHFNFN